jgi:hypothetical protein
METFMLISQLIEPSLACAPLLAASMNKFTALLKQRFGMGNRTKIESIEFAIDLISDAQTSKKLALIFSGSLQRSRQQLKWFFAEKTVIVVGQRIRAAEGAWKAEEWHTLSDAVL